MLNQKLLKLQNYLNFKRCICLNKLKRLQQYLKRNKLSAALLVFPDPNLTYYIPPKNTFSILLVQPKKSTLYLTALDAKPKISGLVVKKMSKSWTKSLTGHNLKRIAINKERLSVKFMEKLKQIYLRARFVDLSEPLKQFRAIKDDQELEYLKRASKISVDSFKALLPRLSKMKTEREVALSLEQEMRRRGGEPAFPTIVASGKNSAIPHHETSDQKLRTGFLLIDFGARYGNYCSDMTRVVYLGQPHRQEIELYGLLLDAQQQALKEIKENISFAELDKFTRKNLGKFSSHFIHSLGHGVGVEIHEAPRFSLDNREGIKKGQVFTIEPGLYFPGRFGLRIEDTVYFNGQTRVLTDLSKNLILVKFKRS